MKAEERAPLVQGSAIPFDHLANEVKTLNPTILYNARGDPYEEGDPNLGYSPMSLKPRYSPSSTHGQSSTLWFDPKLVPSTSVNPDNSCLSSSLKCSLQLPNMNTNLSLTLTLNLVNPPNQVLDRFIPNLNPRIGLLYSSRRACLWI